MASDPVVDGLVGGLLQAAGDLVILLGGLCTGGLVLPDVVRSFERQGLFRTLDELWLPLVGGIATIVVGSLLARAGLRRSRGTGADRSGGDRR